MADINQSNWSETDASNNSASPLGYKSGTMLPSETEPVGRAVMGAVKRWYDHANGTATSAGTNTATLTYTVAPAAYVAGDFYLFKAGGTNTGATTLNVNALGAKTVQRAGGALVANDIQSGFYYGVVYDGTNFQLVFSSRQATQDTSSASNITSGTLPVAQLPVPAATMSTPGNPSGTTSTAAMVMMGLSGAFTPNRSGKLLLIISGDAQNSVAGDGFQYQIRYGTGAAPANAAAVTGTGVGASPVNSPVAGGAVPFTASAIVTGLSVGTTYWLDLSLAAFVGGTASVTNLTVTAFES